MQSEDKNPSPPGDSPIINKVSASGGERFPAEALRRAAKAIFPGFLSFASCKSDSSQISEFCKLQKPFFSDFWVLQAATAIFPGFLSFAACNGHFSQISEFCSLRRLFSPKNGGKAHGSIKFVKENSIFRQNIWRCGEKELVVQCPRAADAAFIEGVFFLGEGALDVLARDNFL